MSSYAEFHRRHFPNEPQIDAPHASHHLNENERGFTTFNPRVPEGFLNDDGSTIAKMRRLDGHLWNVAREMVENRCGPPDFDEFLDRIETLYKQVLAYRKSLG